MTSSLRINGDGNSFRNIQCFCFCWSIFQKINRGDYEAEMKRHNLAEERLQKAREAWNEARLKEIDRINQLHYDKEIGERDLTETNRDLMEINKQFEATKPMLEQFYKPGKQMTEYMNLVKVLGTIPVMYGLLALI